MANEPLGTTVVLIRHAERDTPTATNQDPHLNSAGRSRANGLVHVLGRAGIEIIYTSHFVRSRETAAPLAAHLGGMATEQFDEAPDIKDDILANHAGRTVLVVGHSDTVPALINLLSGSNLSELENREFDNLFVVTVLAAGRASVTALKYGDRS